MEEFKFCKVRKVKSPVRGTAVAAGVDFFVPEDLQESVLVEKSVTTGCNPKIDLDPMTLTVKSITLQPGESVLIPSGIKVKIPHGYAMAFMNKSGVGSKKQLDRLAELVDEDYQGEVHINIVNNGLKPQVISAGDKIIQGVLIPVSYAQPEEVDTPENLYKDSNSDRGEGGFGSTGT